MLATSSSSLVMVWICSWSMTISSGLRSGASVKVRFGSLYMKIRLIRLEKLGFKRLTLRVFWGARWRASQTDSLTWQRYRSTGGSSFCGRWSAWPWPFCPSRRPCFQRERWECSRRLSRDPCTTWARFDRWFLNTHQTWWYRSCHRCYIKIVG